MNLDTPALGPVLQAWMEYRQVGQNELARKSGLDQQTISQLLRGEQKSIRQRRLEMLSRGLSIPYEVLLLCLTPQELLRHDNEGERLHSDKQIFVLISLYFKRRAHALIK